MIVVYTAITNNRDKLQLGQPWDSVSSSKEVRFLAFLDDVTRDSVTDFGHWEYHPIPQKFTDHRMNAKMPKILPHLFFDADYSIWVDGCFWLKTPPEVLIAQVLGGADIAAFLDKVGRSVLGQMQIFSSRHAEQREAIEAQKSSYMKQGVDLSKPACECGVLIRRHTTTKLLNLIWWSEICRWSVRDQLSFIKSVDESKVKLVHIPGTVCRSDYFSKTSHNKGV